jgi:hypothetical protein
MWPLKLEETEEQNSVAAGHHVEEAAQWHDEHCRIEKLLGAVVNELL